MKPANAKKPHIHLEPSPRYARVITCGSPERAARFAEKLSNPQPVAKNREYHSYLGQHQGKDILIISHGVGAAGAAICFQELIDVGAQAIVRIGTAGALADELGIADVVVATSAVRKDGLSHQMVPAPFPAVADFELCGGLIQSLRAKGWTGKAGTVLTSDLFYPGLLDGELELYKNARALAVEMEISALYVVSQLRGVRAAAAIVLDGNPLKWKEGHYDPRPERLAASMDLCLQGALDALAAQQL